MAVKINTSKLGCLSFAKGIHATARGYFKQFEVELKFEVFEKWHTFLNIKLFAKKSSTNLSQEKNK